jgi:hypothetical protein
MYLRFSQCFSSRFKPLSPQAGAHRWVNWPRRMLGHRWTRTALAEMPKNLRGRLAAAPLTAFLWERWI